MEDRREELLSQYDLSVESVKKIRGMYVIMSDQGLKLLAACNRSEYKVAKEARLLEGLKKRTDIGLDTYVLSSEGTYLVSDSMGNRYLMRDWYRGEECSLQNMDHIRRASRTLSKLHQAMEDTQQVFSDDSWEENNIIRIYEKHTREMKRLYSYILGKKQKNDFEISWMSVFPSFYEEAQKALERLTQSAYPALWQKEKEQRCFQHNNYTYHNILILRDGEAVTEFQKAKPGLQLWDLYMFLRKSLEKNAWDAKLADEIMKSYDASGGLAKEQIDLLEIFLSYPEKFWKLSNYYYNSRKNWVSIRTREKLEQILSQQTLKTRFLKSF